MGEPRTGRRTVAAVVATAVLPAVLVASCSSRAPRGVTDREDATVPDHGETMPSGITTSALGEGRWRVAHGPVPEGRFADLALPPGAGPFPVVVLVHGGFWRAGFALDLMVPLVDGLLAAGHAVLNLEYRGVGAGGGHPATFLDVAAGVDALAAPAVAAAVAPATLRLDRVVVVGHSAGGHLAAWAAGRGVLPSGAVGADPVVQPCAVVSQAGVNDLVGAAAAGVGGTAATDLLGVAPADAPDLVAVTSPMAMLPLGVPVLVVHGADDVIVPIWQSTDFAAAAEAAGDRVEVVVGPGDHFAVIDPDDALWTTVLDRLDRLCSA